MSTQKQKLVIYSLFIIAGISYVLTVNPHSAPLVLLFTPFIWLFLLFYTLINHAIYFYDAEAVRGKITSLVVSSIITIVIILQTLHQLSVKDLAIAIGFGLLMSWYVRKLISAQSKL